MNYEIKNEKKGFNSIKYNLLSKSFKDLSLIEKRCYINPNICLCNYGVLSRILFIEPNPPTPHIILAK